MRKDYCKPSELRGEELDREIEKLIEESEKLTDWPEVDVIYDDE